MMPPSFSTSSSSSRHAWPRGEQAQLWWDELARGRDHGLRERLIQAYQGYARMLAAKYYAQRHGDDIGFDEYFQLAQLGLLEACDRFDPARGVIFETYAGKRIAGAIVDGIAQMTEVQQQLAERRRRNLQRLDSMDAGAMAPESVDALFGRLAELAVGLAIGFVLDGGEDSSACQDPSYTSMELRQLRELVLVAVRALPDKVRHVISAHYLQQRSFAEVASELQLTAGRVSQLHRDGLERLRHALKRHGGFDLRC